MATIRLSLQAANIPWLDNDAPLNIDHKDGYYSIENAVAESYDVLIKGNKLAQRWALSHTRFAIGEIGFGTGLSFILTCQRWQQAIAGTPSAQLHYVSVDSTPLNKRDLSRALAILTAKQNDLAPFISELLKNYPPLVSGFHTIKMCNNQVTLHLLLGDENTALASLRHSDRSTLSQTVQGIDAWYLNAFTPTPNPEIWTETLFRTICALSAKDCTFSAFSTTGVMEELLEKNTELFKKHLGLDHVRDSFTGIIKPSTAHIGANFQHPNSHKVYRRNGAFPAATWYHATTRSIETTEKKSTSPKNQSNTSRVAIIGSGIAASTTARALAERGIACTVYEKEACIAAGASGNIQAALYARLSPYSSPYNDFSLTSYLYALRYYHAFIDSPTQGLLQLFNEPELAVSNMLAEQVGSDEFLQILSKEDASTAAGVTIGQQALLFPHGRSVAMNKLCENLLDHPLISCETSQNISALKLSEGIWHLLIDDSKKTLATAQNVVVCLGADSARYEQLSWLPLKAIRGQVSYLPATAESATLKKVVCGSLSIAPAENKLHSIGSSYVLGDRSPDIRDSEHLSNIEGIARMLPSLPIDPKKASRLNGRAAIRCTSPDYLPMCGPVPDKKAFIKDFATLRTDRKRPLNINAQHLPGLYVNTAYGSRGLCFAPLCAEHLLSQMCKELSPLPSNIRHALLPGRFIIRNITRGKDA